MNKFLFKSKFKEVTDIDIHARALSTVASLQQRALDNFVQQNDGEAMACFKLAMKICNTYVSKVKDFPNLLRLATSYKDLGLAILERESSLKAHNRVALECLSFSLNIQKDLHQNHTQVSRQTKDIETTVLDLATAFCHVARAYLQIEDTKSALKHVRYAIYIVVLDGKSGIPSVHLDDPKCKKVISYCCTTKAQIFATRMQKGSSKDKRKALKYFNLAIHVQEKGTFHELHTLATCHTQLASFLYNIGDIDGAYQNYERVLEIRNSTWKNCSYN